MAAGGEKKEVLASLLLLGFGKMPLWGVIP